MAKNSKKQANRNNKNIKNKEQAKLKTHTQKRKIK